MNQSRMMGKMVELGAMAAMFVAGGLLCAACASGGSSGGGSGGDGGSDSGGNGECQSDDDCKGDRICVDGACKDPPVTGGGQCADAGESCQNVGCCDGECVNDPSGPICHDACNVGSDCNSGCCALLENGASVCASADHCSSGPKGDDAPCASDDECASGVCVGWCTRYCSSDFDCSGWCIQNAAGSFICFPGCNDDSDCYQYGSGVSCQTGSTIDGTTADVCAG